MKKSRLMILLGLLGLSLVIVAILGLNEIGNSSTPTPTPTPTASIPNVTPQPTPTPTAVNTQTPTPSNTNQTTTPEPTLTPENTGPLPTPTPTPTNSFPIATPTPTAATPTPTPTPVPTSTPIGDPSETTVALALAHNQRNHEDPEDYVWNSSEVVSISLNGNSIAVNPVGRATVQGSKVTITSSGTYSITGTLNDGTIAVNVPDDGTVRLILNGAQISCSTTATIYIMDAQKAIIILADNTQNSVIDSSNYIFENPTETEPNAAIFSKADLTISGEGSLNVEGKYLDGIACKDGLIIKSATITVTSVDDGIRGQDYIVVKSGNIDINAGGDGLKSDNDENTARGYIYIENGNLQISSGADAVQAQTDILASGGEISLVSGGGSTTVLVADQTAKGLKATASLIIDGGKITANCADDTIHCNSRITINNGSFLLNTGDDAIHADASITINGGNITVAKAYEGIESAVITINNGDIHITSSDDAINIAGGTDQSGIRPGRDTFAPGTYDLYINGGYIYARSYLTSNIGGDGLDSNGRITMTGGTVIVEAPANFTQVAIDHNGNFNMTGGLLIGVGTIGAPGIAPAQGTTASVSTQYSVMVNFRTGFYSGSNALPAGTLFNIRTSNGTELVTFRPTAAYQSVVFSSPALKAQRTYIVDYGGTSTGTIQDGLCIGGTYTPKTMFRTFTITSMVTTINPI